MSKKRNNPETIAIQGADYRSDTDTNAEAVPIPDGPAPTINTFVFRHSTVSLSEAKYIFDLSNTIDGYVYECIFLLQVICINKLIQTCLKYPNLYF